MHCRALMALPINRRKLVAWITLCYQGPPSSPATFTMNLKLWLALENVAYSCCSFERLHGFILIMSNFIKLVNAVW
jgi:hypothetical protein